MAKRIDETNKRIDETNRRIDTVNQHRLEGDKGGDDVISWKSWFCPISVYSPKEQFSISQFLATLPSLGLNSDLLAEGRVLSCKLF